MELLTSLYENRNAAQVAEILHCTRGAVLDALRRHDLPIKDVSEAQKLKSEFPGSSTPRPRTKFLETMQDEDWLRERAERGDSLASIARESGATATSVQQAIAKFDITQPTLPVAQRETPRQIPYKERPARRIGEKSTLGGTYAAARQLCPEGPCVVCQRPGQDVNHIDRNPWNNSLANLERLCKHCHVNQHAQETRDLIDFYRLSGRPFAELAAKSRAKVIQALQSGEKVNRRAH